MTRNYPQHPPAQRQYHSKMAGHLEPRSAARENIDRSPPSGFGILLEVANDRIVGAVPIEHSPVLRPEAEVDIIVGNTKRRGLSLVEAYGDGPAPSGNLRHGADLYVVDPETADFVLDAIREKVARADEELGEGVWHARLSCRLVKVNYDWPNRTGKLFMADGSNCDWSEAVRLFKSIDPEVEAVEAYAGGNPDTRYVRQDGEWQLSLPARNP